VARKAKRGARRGKRGVLDRLIGRFKTAVTTVVLLAAGALLGSFFQEWRHTRASDASDPAVTAPAPQARLKVEVLNGSGERGAARVVGDLLLARGYDVVATDNADHFDYPVTHVLDRSDLGVSVREVAAAIGVDSVAVAVDSEMRLDATVILGHDWRKRIRSRDR